MAINSDVIIGIALRKLNKKPYVLALTKANPPHDISRWEGGDTRPTDAQINAAYADWVKETGGLDMEKLSRDRTEKLQFSDWRACSDVTMSNEWKAYRQALRDLPANTSDPKKPTWPTEPTGGQL